MTHTRVEPRCRNCGCSFDVHQHFHDKDYCGYHGPEVCQGWRDGRGWWARLRARLGR